ncbi:hypothetical protein [Serratia sp. N21D137]|uniref:hypothetical protein n=1 Tax=Serratia sp. N21D137 TaxID=3397495 RepID=UPI0039E15D0A
MNCCYCKWLRWLSGYMLIILAPLAMATVSGPTTEVYGRAPTVTPPPLLDNLMPREGDFVSIQPNTGVFSDADGDAEFNIGYQWKLNDINISVNGTSSSYKLVAGDGNGNKLTVCIIPRTDPKYTVPFEGHETCAVAVATQGSAPVASNVTITGLTQQGATLTGSYTYSDADGDLEDKTAATGTKYQWYHNNTNTPISGATNMTYEVQASDIGKKLIFGVTPKAKTGVNLTGGQAVSVATATVTSGAAPVASNVTITGLTQLKVQH